MFTHETILLLRGGLSECAASLPVCGHFRDYHFVRNVMEVKQHLLRCLRNNRPALLAMPDFIVVDAGPSNSDIKSELERWLEKHPRLGRIKVVFPPPRPWVLRLWTRICAFAAGRDLALAAINPA
jgi:hypothetical protein